MYLIQQIWGLLLVVGAMGLLAGLWSRKRFDADRMALAMDEQVRRARADTEDLETDHARVLAAAREEYECMQRSLRAAHADAVLTLRTDHAKAIQALKARCDSLAAQRRGLELAFEQEKELHTSARAQLRRAEDAARAFKAQAEKDLSEWMTRARTAEAAETAARLRLQQREDESHVALVTLTQQAEESRAKEAQRELHINHLKVSGELSRRIHVDARVARTEDGEDWAASRDELEALVEDLQEQLAVTRQTLEHVVQASESKEERLSVEIIEQRAELERLRRERAQSMRRAVGQHRASRLALLGTEDVESLVREAGNGRPPLAAPLEGLDPDDLTQVAGIDAQTENWLHGMGIFFYWQIATWTPEEAAWVAHHVPRVGVEVWRGNWMAQCARLAARVGLPA